MKKIFFLVHLILIGAGTSLHSDQAGFLELPLDEIKICYEDYFLTLYEEGVSFLMTGKYSQSEEVFTCILDSQAASEDIKGAALWGRVWSNACLGKSEGLIEDLDRIVDLIGLNKPCDCSSSVCLAAPQKGGRSPMCFAEAFSEDSQTQFMFCDMEHCLKTVDNCAVFMNGMCAVIKDSGAQFTLRLFIDGLAKKSKDCCRAGGFWRNCVQKMVDVMNKWKLLGIPADPAWD